MSTQTSLYIGLISGTSIDGVDAALVDFSSNQPKLLASHCHAVPPDLREAIKSLCTPSITSNEIDLLGETDRALGELFAEASLALLEQASVLPGQVCAIGSHGQTIRHRPGNRGFTLQIADPNILSLIHI